MPNIKKSQWSDIRKRLLLLGNKELIAQIKDLYAISDENRRFLEARFAQGQEQVRRSWQITSKKFSIAFLESEGSATIYPGCGMHAG